MLESASKNTDACGPPPQRAFLPCGLGFGMSNRSPDDSDVHTGLGTTGLEPVLYWTLNIWWMNGNHQCLAYTRLPRIPGSLAFPDCVPSVLLGCWGRSVGLRLHGRPGAREHAQNPSTARCHTCRRRRGEREKISCSAQGSPWSSREGHANEFASEGLAHRRALVLTVKSPWKPQPSCALPLGLIAGMSLNVQRVNQRQGFSWSLFFAFYIQHLLQ